MSQNSSCTALLQLLVRNLVSVSDKGTSSRSRITNDAGDLLDELFARRLGGLADALGSLTGSLANRLGRGLGDLVVDLLGLGDTVDGEELGLEDCGTLLGGDLLIGSEGGHHTEG